MRTPARLRLTALATTLAILAAGATAAQATPPPTQFVLSSYWGAGIDETTGGNICTIASKDKCREEGGQVWAQESTEPGGFNYPKSIAVDNDPSSPEYNDVYVDDENNHRVQILSPTGAFVSMFGEKGGMPGQMDEPFSIAIDATSGNVYLAEKVQGEVGGKAGFGYRVQEFTGTGTWVLEIGKDVNGTKKTNLCTEHEVEAE